MREVGAEELFERCDHPFLRHQLPPASVRRGWRLGEAVVVESHRARGRGGPGGEPAYDVVLIGLGPVGDLGPLLARLAAEERPPERLTVTAPAADDVPAAWRLREPKAWHWMLTREPPPDLDAGFDVADVTDDAEVDRVLDGGYPGAHARPGAAGLERWLGVREAEATVAVGALFRSADGTGSLRGVTVLPSAAGRGVGTALSAALTRRALAGRSGVAALGVYVDNAAALRIYRRLGYAVADTFVSGPVSDRASTSASAPSR